jgi:hypothetical protein
VKPFEFRFSVGAGIGYLFWQDLAGSGLTALDRAGANSGRSLLPEQFLTKAERLRCRANVKEPPQVADEEIIRPS